MSVRIALLFGFDGTIYVGDLPVLSYARHCAEQLPPAAATAMIDGIRFFLEGKTISDRRIDLTAAEDGYEAVEMLAEAAGLLPAQVDAAYRLARADLAASAFALEPPDGLTELLHDLVDVRVMVVTDAAAIGVAEVLSAIGLAEQIDEVIAVGCKQDTMPHVIDGVLRQIGAAGQPDRLMVVGDRWEADLADAGKAGAVTGMIDRFGRANGSPTVRAANLAGLIPDIRKWAVDHGALTAGGQS